jgi:hypothetical protein
MFIFEKGYQNILVLCVLFSSLFSIFVEESDEYLLQIRSPLTCRNGLLSSATTGVTMLETKY